VIKLSLLQNQTQKKIRKYIKKNYRL
jgi:hypothetical protein